MLEGGSMLFTVKSRHVSPHLNAFCNFKLKIKLSENNRVQ